MLAERRKLFSRVEATIVLYRLVSKSQQLRGPLHARARLDGAALLDHEVEMLADRIEQFVTGNTAYKADFPGGGGPQRSMPLE